MPTDVIITGFTKSQPLLLLSLSPLCTLKREGLIRDIHYVTWDSAEIDPYVAPLAKIPQVNLVRVPQQDVQGTGNQRGVVYQSSNLAAGLDLISGNNTVVLKTRPDFVLNVNFLRKKIESFEQWSAVPESSFATGLPAPALRNRIWLPWADANQFFFYADMAFMGRKGDLKKLVTELTPEEFELLGDPDCGWYAHSVRFAHIFASRYPIFARYMQDYRYFVNNVEYRSRQLSLLLSEGFFWHLAVAHAWILYSQFHVDAGAQGDIMFFANNHNQKTDWSNPATFRLSTPFESVRGWRESTKPQSTMLTMRRTYGRLMDDAWQQALFTNPPPDLPAEKLAAIVQNIAQYDDGRFETMEDLFFLKLEAFHRQHWLERSRSPDDIVQVAGAGGQHHQTVEAHRHAG